MIQGEKPPVAPGTTVPVSNMKTSQAEKVPNLKDHLASSVKGNLKILDNYKNPIFKYKNLDLIQNTHKLSKGEHHENENP